MSPTTAESWSAARAEYGRHLLAAGRSIGTRRQVEVLLRLLERNAGELGPWQLTADDLELFLSFYPWQPATRAQKRALLSAFYQWGTDSGRCSSSPATQLGSVKVPRKQPRPCPDAVLTAALATARPQLQLQLMLGAYAGMRVHEIAATHTDWLDLERGQLRITGKGGRQRIVPIHRNLKTPLSAAEPGFLFPGRTGAHVTADAVGRAISRALGGKWTAHTLRHRFATRAFAAERDIQAVQQLLGHSSPATTVIYTALPDDALRAAVDAV